MNHTVAVVLFNGTRHRIIVELVARRPSMGMDIGNALGVGQGQHMGLGILTRSVTDIPKNDAPHVGFRR